MIECDFPLLLLIFFFVDSEGRDGWQSEVGPRFERSDAHASFAHLQDPGCGRYARRTSEAGRRETR